MARDTSTWCSGRIGLRVGKALTELFDERDPAEAAFYACVVAAATSKKENPTGQDEVAFEKFVEENHDLIWMAGRVRLGSVTLIARGLVKKHPSVSQPAGLGKILYRLVRCPAVHEAGLDQGVTFSPVEDRLSFALSNDYPQVLPWSVLYGLILAVIGSERNSDEKIPEKMCWRRPGKMCRERPWTYGNDPGLPRLNDLWGKKDEIVRLAISRLVVGGPDGGINFGVPGGAK